MPRAGVPEVAHHEDRHPCPAQDDVRPAPTQPQVHAEAQPAGMQRPAKGELGTGVADPLPAHLLSHKVIARRWGDGHPASLDDAGRSGVLRMVTRGRREEVIPSAARLLGSLRDLGYDFSNAVADLIDNSITAGASRVDVTIHFDGADSWVRIADNGDGMSGTAITEAMRLGSGGRDYTGDDLGKFGLGLKTASLSQARSITVTSRSNRDRRTIDCRQLDLDDVLASDRWEIVHPFADARPHEAVEPLENGTGTVVLWHKLDRVLSRKDPFGGWAERHLLQLAARLDLHLGMVFERFLTGQTRRRRKKLLLTINGAVVEPWDPFCRNEKTELLPEHQIPVGGSMVLYRPFVLPPQRDFSDDDAWRRASGPNQWNRQQGLYIYRADRLIQSGGWSWLRGQDEHTKLARAALDFMPDLDDTFEINISKMRVKLPEELRDQLRPLITFLTRRAEDRYRRSSRFTRPPPPPPPTGTGGRPPAAGGRASGGTEGSSGPPTAGPAAPQTGHPSGLPPTGDDPPGVGDARTVNPARYGHVAEALQAAAEQEGVLDALGLLRQALARDNPEVAHDLGW